MKMAVVELVKKYDLTFEDPSARRQWMWETFTMPYESTKVLIRTREL
jgi:hypothetical protein